MFSLLQRPFIYNQVLRMKIRQKEASKLNVSDNIDTKLLTSSATKVERARKTNYIFFIRNSFN